MSSTFDIKFNESVFCTELTSGKNYSGNFLFGDDGITTTLISFDGYFFVKPDAPIILMTEKLAFVSLYDSYSALLETNSRNVEPIRTAHIQKISSNTAVVGDDEWTVKDRIKRISFGVRNSMELLRNHDKIDRLSKVILGNDDKQDDWLLLNFKANGMFVRLYYTAKYEMWGKEPREIEPRFELEFDKAIQLGEHIEPMKQVLSFCSMALGLPLAPSEIRISRRSLVEFLDDVENHRPTWDHRILYRCQEFEIDPGEIDIFGSPVYAYEADGLENLGKCLRVWLERGSECNDAYTLMMGALVSRNKFGPERLLNACKWFEALPNSKPKQEINKEALEKIADAAIEAANSLGISDIESRIKGSLKSIGQESRDLLFRRLIALAWHSIPIPHPFEEMVSDLKGSQRLRGKAAHGNLRTDGNQNAKNIIRYTDALEALCMLLTVRDLPLSVKGSSQMWQHRIVRNYRLSDT
jgi:hypothetical protein